MKHLLKKCVCVLAAGIMAFLLFGTQADASDALGDEYRKPSLSGPVQTFIYQGESFESSRNRVFADDQEDGDLTTDIVKTGNVDTSVPGTYTVTYQVEDSDGNSTQMSTTVKVLDRDHATEADKAVRKTLYTLPAADHLTNIGFDRGYYHDRQSLGIWIPAGEEISIRLVNGDEFTQNLNLQLKNNDSRLENLAVITENENGTKTESGTTSSVNIPSSGEWVTVRNKIEEGYEDSNPIVKGDSADSVPFITTPKGTAVQPVIEIKWNDNFEEIPYYRYGDDEDDFFHEWEESSAPFAIIEGDAATFLVPIADMDNIVVKSNTPVDRFGSIDQMLEWYAEFIRQYDEYSGLDFHAEEPYNQNVRAKFFIKANAHGVGAAYYTTDHSANNDAQLGGYLTKAWVCLHEFGHGYEGSIATQENPFVETTNNILGYYFSHGRPEDSGWMLYNFSGTTAERYAALGKYAEDRRNATNTFEEIVEGGEHYNASLFMFTNVLDKLGPKETVKAMHTQYRKYCYENGATTSSSDVIADSFSHTGGYNVIPYFESWHIKPSDAVKDKIYNLDLPMVYYLKNLIPDAAECEAVRSELGLDGIYSLVSTEELKDTGYVSQAELKLSIDDFTQIQNKNILFKNGETIVKKVPITDENIIVELPIGIYEVELPAPRSAGYTYQKEYLAASKGNVSKEFCYTKITGNLLVDNTQIELLGISDWKAASISLDTERQKLIWDVENIQPHYVFDDTYISIRVLDVNGTEIYSQSLIGNVTAEALTEELDFPVGSKLEIYHREGGSRVRFVSAYSSDRITAYNWTGAGTVTYVMTDKGLMQEDWSESKQMNIYLSVLNSYSEYFMENMTQGDVADPLKFYNEKMTMRIAYDSLDEEAKKEYCAVYGVLLGMEPDSYKGTAKIDSSRLTGFADSENTKEGNESASAALDGDESTHWHSNYGNGTWADIEGGKNNSYTILLDKNTDIGKLEYVPRNDSPNGRILSYELSYSTTENGDDFQEIAVRDNTWADDASTKSVEFYAPNARRIRIKALSTEGTGQNQNKFISAAEFYLYEVYEIYTKNTYLSDLYPEAESQVQQDSSGNGQAISMVVNGQERIFEKGIGLSAQTKAIWNLEDRNFDVLSAWLGIEAGMLQDSEASVEIYGDGVLLYQSDTIYSGDPAEPIYLDISGINKLEIRVLGTDKGTLVSFGDAKLISSSDISEITLKVGESAAILAGTSLIPQDRGIVSWESEDTSVAEVGDDGVVTAVGEGSAAVRAIFGEETVSCTVTVHAAPEKNFYLETARTLANNILDDFDEAYRTGAAIYTENTMEVFLRAYKDLQEAVDTADIAEINRLYLALLEAGSGLERLVPDNKDDSVNEGTGNVPISPQDPSADEKTPNATVEKPAKVNIKKVKASKKQAAVSWKKVANADGYEIWVRKGKGAFKKAKSVSAKKLKVKIKKLKSGKKYTFKVRAYRKGASGSKIYGAFSKTKKVKVK